jgi:hypothetical protein
MLMPFRPPVLPAVAVVAVALNEAHQLSEPLAVLEAAPRATSDRPFDLTAVGDRDGCDEIKVLSSACEVAERAGLSVLAPS